MESAAEKFKQIRVIGVGNFGTVVLAEYIEDKKLYAIKSVVQSEKFRSRQLEIMRELNNPAIVKLAYIYFRKKMNDGSNGSYQNQLSLVMEYVPRTLFSLLHECSAKKELLAISTVLSVTHSLLTALAYLASKNIGHRDIKPSNILVTDEMQAKLCDFGSAKMITTSQTSVAYICSRYYRAPQLLFGSTHYSTQIDVWSLGCIISQMLTGKVLFMGKDANEMVVKICRILGPPTSEDLKAMDVKLEGMIATVEAPGIFKHLVNVCSSTPVGLLDLVNRMLVFSPTKRIQAKEALQLPIFSSLGQPL